MVENLAKDLRAEFPGVGGFSAVNLWRIKQFYESYAKHKKLAPLVREISWTKNLVILERCKESAERQFYFARTKQSIHSGSVVSMSTACSPTAVAQHRNEKLAVSRVGKREGQCLIEADPAQLGMFGTVYAGSPPAQAVTRKM